MWRLALPTNCVVAVQLTEPVLRAVFATNGLQFDPSRPFLRRDTWHSEDKPGCAACPLGVTRQGDRTMRGGSAFSVQRPSLCLPRRRTEVSAGDYLVGDITFTEPPLVGPLVQSGGEARPCWLWKTTNKVRSRVQPPRSRGDVSRGSSGRGSSASLRLTLNFVPCSQVVDGQTLITRTVNRVTFLQTYRPLALSADGSPRPDSLAMPA